MASTTSETLGLELITYGEKSNSWGDIVNTNLKILERSVAGYAEVEVTGPSVTLSAVDWTLGTWHNHALRLTGTLVANSFVNVPPRERVWLVENATAGAYTLTVRPTGGTGVVVPAGQRALLVCDGTDIAGVVLQPYSANLVQLASGNGTLTAYRETRVTGAALATTILDLSSANVFEITQAVNITTLTFANPPPSGTAYSFTLIRKKDATATAYAIAWPATVRWPSGVAPILTQLADAVDTFSFLTTDGGLNWLGYASGTDHR